MRSPTAALLWDLWLRHRTLIRLLVAVTAVTCLLNVALPEHVRTAGINSDTFDTDDALRVVNFHLVLAGLLLFLSVCGYTELDPQRGSIGFPHRLYTLPLTSLRLVALPAVVGIVVFELLGLLWRTVVFRQAPDSWEMLLIGAYVVAHQTVLWTLSRLGFLRVLVLGVLAIVFIVALGLPTFPPEMLPWWLRADVLRVLVPGLAFASFLVSWTYVAQQRSGGQSRRDWVRRVVSKLTEALPRRKKAFGSAAGAHFWFEWRRSGFLLPLLVSATLIAVVGPLSWMMRDGSEATARRILFAVLAMPVVLAFPVGKAFSKPDLWSSDMSISPFVAVKPIATEELVFTKMKVAAASATVSWLAVLLFIGLWFGVWARTDGLGMIRLLLWSLYGRSVYPQYGLAILSLIAGMLLTWRFLVSGLWLGLSGSRRLFATTAIAYCFIPAVALGIAAITSGKEESILNWFARDFGRTLPALVRTAAIAVGAKFWIAAWSWRNIDQSRVRRYLILWLCGSLGLIAWALLVWSGLRFLPAADSHQLRTLLVLGALLANPLARPGLAPGSLARNRHKP